MMLGRLAIVLALAVFTGSWSRAAAEEKAPPRAAGESSGVDRPPRGPPDPLVWKLRIEPRTSSVALDGFRPGPDGMGSWELSHAIWTYRAGPGDPTPRGFRRYRVSGLGGWSDVRAVRLGDRVVLFSTSGPSN